VRFRAADTTLDSPRAARQWLEGLLSES